MVEMRKISVDIRKEHYDKLKDIAEEEQVKLSDVIRIIIRVYLE